MNNAIIYDVFGNESPTKLSDKQILDFKKAGIKFKVLSKVEKPEVLKKTQKETNPETDKE